MSAIDCYNDYNYYSTIVIIIQQRCVSSMRNICRAYQDGSVRFDTAGEIFASCDLFNGRAIFAEHFELVPVVAVEMVVERFSG